MSCPQCIELRDAVDNVGCYPAAINGEPRTPFGDGWNACADELRGKVTAITERNNQPYDPHRDILNILDAGWWEDGRLILNMNDIFAYACADAEEVLPDEMPELGHLARMYGHAGITYWVSKKRNEIPNIPLYRDEVEAITKLEKLRDARRRPRTP